MSPSIHVFIPFFKQIQLLGTKFCLDKNGRKLNQQIGIHECHGNGYTQGFSYQKNQQIVFHHNECLSLAKMKINTAIPTEAKLLKGPNALTVDAKTTNHIVLLQCNATSGEKWEYNDNVSKKKMHQLIFYIDQIEQISHCLIDTSNKASRLRTVFVNRRMECCCSSV